MIEVIFKQTFISDVIRSKCLSKDGILNVSAFKVLFSYGKRLRNEAC